MSKYYVAGQTVISWDMTVEANSEGEAESLAEANWGLWTRDEDFEVLDCWEKDD